MSRPWSARARRCWGPNEQARKGARPASRKKAVKGRMPQAPDWWKWRWAARTSRWRKSRPAFDSKKSRTGSGASRRPLRRFQWRRVEGGQLVLGGEAAQRGGGFRVEGLLEESNGLGAVPAEGALAVGSGLGRLAGSHGSVPSVGGWHCQRREPSQARLGGGDQPPTSSARKIR